MIYLCLLIAIPVFPHHFFTHKQTFPVYAECSFGIGTSLSAKLLLLPFNKPIIVMSAIRLPDIATLLSFSGVFSAL